MLLIRDGICAAVYLYGVVRVFRLQIVGGLRVRGCASDH